jgi:tRNA threonylcarbamoyladenosine biosynthesis protein TsaB
VTTICAFDAATSIASCAVVRDGAVLAEETTGSRQLLMVISACLQAADTSLGELDALVVGRGPGSFTSIRIALATARALGFGLGIPAAGVSTLRAFSGGQAVIDARRGEVFTDGPRLARPEDITVDGTLLIGDGALRYRALFEAAGAEIPPEGDPRHQPSAAALVTRAGCFGDPELIEPLYLRAPDAALPR